MDRSKWRSWLSMWKNNIIEMEKLESSNCVQEVANSLIQVMHKRLIWQENCTDQSELSLKAKEFGLHLIRGNYCMFKKKEVTLIKLSLRKINTVPVYNIDCQSDGQEARRPVLDNNYSKVSIVLVKQGRGHFFFLFPLVYSNIY